MRSSAYMMTVRICVVAIATVVLGGRGSALPADRDAAKLFPESTHIDSTAPREAARILNTYTRLPTTFAENRGQMDARVRYYAQGRRYGFYLTGDGVVIALEKASAALDSADARDVVTRTTAGAIEGVALSLQFLGSKRRTCTFTLTGTAAVTANVQ
jgi:hypothetical protein